MFTHIFLLLPSPSQSQSLSALLWQILFLIYISDLTKRWKTVTFHCWVWIQCLQFHCVCVCVIVSSDLCTRLTTLLDLGQTKHGTFHIILISLYLASPSLVKYLSRFPLCLSSFSTTFLHIMLLLGASLCASFIFTILVFWQNLLQNTLHTAPHTSTHHYTPLHHLHTPPLPPPKYHL